MTDREVECAQLFEVTDAGFVKNVVAPEKISLTDVALTEAIQNRSCDGVLAVGNRVGELFPLT
jgi:hypothetical protein